MSVHLYIYSQAEGLQRHKTLEPLKSLPDEATVWIDIDSEDSGMLGAVANHFGLHELTVEDCLDADHSPKLEDYGKYLFMIFRGFNPEPFIDDAEKEQKDGEEVEEEDYSRSVAIYLSETYIITHRNEEVPWLDAVRRQVKAIPERTIAEGVDVLAHRIIDVLIDRFTRGLNHFEDKIDLMEDQVIESPEDFEMSHVLETKRVLSLLRQIMRDQRVVITRLAHEATLIREGQLRTYFRDIEDHAQAIIKTIDKQIDALSGVRDAYFAMSNVRLGDIMRILAVITTLAVPLNLVVGMYGMNFEAIPLLHDPHGFWLIVVVMVTLAILMLVFFRKQRWI